MVYFTELFARVRSQIWRHLKTRRFKGKVLPIIVLVVILSAVAYSNFLSPPKGFNTPALIRIHKGETLSEISAQLKKQKVIRSEVLFECMVRVMGGNRTVRDGPYLFSSPQNIFTVSSRFAHGDFDVAPVRITVIEGDTVREVASQLSSKLYPFDTKIFLSLASSSEGRLYPDTYFFYPGAEEQDILGAMKDNFDKHIVSIGRQILESKHSLDDALIVASILTGEARTQEDRRLVAGVLWKRISLGMPLQVDAPFGYILQKRLIHLTPADLAINSPYNTYRNKGLPPTPIGNPGIEAIEAALLPAKTQYLYYLSDENGKLHFSTTFEDHKENIQTYL